MTQLVAAAQGVILTNGQSYLFEFTSLSYLRPAEMTDSASFTAFFASGTFSDGETVMVDIFPDSPSDTPLSASYTHVCPANPQEGYGIRFLLSSAPPFWPDLQGVVRVTMLNGDGELNSFAARQIVGGNVYSQFFPVPEPSSLSLGICAAALVTLFRAFRKSSPNKSAANVGIASLLQSARLVAAGAELVRPLATSPTTDGTWTLRVTFQRDGGALGDEQTIVISADQLRAALKDWLADPGWRHE